MEMLTKHYFFQNITLNIILDILVSMLDNSLQKGVENIYISWIIIEYYFKAIIMECSIH